MRSSIEHNKRFFAIFLAVFAFLVLIFTVPLAFAADTDTELQHGEYIGAGYIVGTDNKLGRVEVYLPINYADSFGSTTAGYLVNVTSNTITGVMYDSSGRLYTWRAPSFNTPEYRLASSSSYTYTPSLIKVVDTNINVATEWPVAHSFDSMFPLIVVGFLGVIILCLMRFRH